MQRSQLVKKQLEKYGEYSPSVVVDDLYGSLKSRKDSAGSVIEDITAKMGDTPVDTSKSIKVIDNVLTRANRLGKVANKDLIRGLSDLREELAKPDIDFGLLRELRSALRESIQGDAMVFPNSAKAATDTVERAMGADLRNNAARYLGLERPPDTSRQTLTTLTSSIRFLIKGLRIISTKLKKSLLQS